MGEWSGSYRPIHVPQSPIISDWTRSSATQRNSASPMHFAVARLNDQGHSRSNITLLVKDDIIIFRPVLYNYKCSNVNSESTENHRFWPPHFHLTGSLQRIPATIYPHTTLYDQKLYSFSLSRLHFVIDSIGLCGSVRRTYMYHSLSGSYKLLYKRCV